MRLSDRKYAEFKISALFNVKYGVNLELDACIECSKSDSDAVNFVARTAENNGVSAYVRKIDGINPQKAGLISVAGGGSVLSIFLQDAPFYSGRDLYVLDSKDNISDEAKMFIITVIEQNKYKYSYGRQANKTLPDILLKLPINDEGNPDYKFMEDYIKSLHYKPLTTHNLKNQPIDLEMQGWKEYRVGDIFPKKIVKHFSAIPEIEGRTPFISSASTNNGVAAYVDEDGIKGGCITVSTNGDCFDCFYQPGPIVLSNDAEALYNDNLNVYNAIFIITVMRLEKNKYGYGRKPKNDKVYDTFIKLPAGKNNDPNWQFMEDYIKALPYGDRLIA